MVHGGGRGLSGAEFERSRNRRLSGRRFKRMAWQNLAWLGRDVERETNKSLKNFSSQSSGMYVSGPTSNLNSFKVADPSKRGGEGERTR